MLNALPRPRFLMGSMVFLKLNPEDQGMITGILYRPNSMLYYIAWGDGTETSHYDIEITTERWKSTEQN